MLFNSFAFAIFLPIVFTIYWLIPHRFRWLLLLASSYYFYMSWNIKYVFLILFTTIVSYITAILIENENSTMRKRALLFGSAVLCLGVLFFFKYYNFASESVASFFGLFAIELNPTTLKLVLPVGISFYTFQTLSYVIDVYRGDVRAEHHLGYYATFISFFPQLVAGPIERTSNLLPQIKGKHIFDYEQATYGLKLMMWGFFKKIVIADALSFTVEGVYDMPYDYKGFALVLATVFFTLQIYCDFSGYSDIAIGTAKLLGINLMTNFKSPYFSQSIKEFWSRWHISLSTWFRDYIYIPLGGSRVGKVRHILNLIITFLLSGLWHGANWTFVVWGGIHGIAQALEGFVLIPMKKEKCIELRKWAKRLFVFLFVSFAWIFFVSNSIDEAFYVISNILVGITSPLSYILSGFSDTHNRMNILEMFFLLISLGILSIYDYLSINRDVIMFISSRKTILRWIIYCVFTIWVIINISYKPSSEFVYFQF